MIGNKVILVYIKVASSDGGGGSGGGVIEVDVVGGAAFRIMATSP